MKMKAVIILSFVVLMAGIVVPGEASPCLDEINQERNNNEKSTLTADKRLETLAKEHVEVMISKNCAKAQCPGELPLQKRLDGAGYPLANIGMTVNRGAGNCTAALTKWMGNKSAKNYLMGDFQDAGCHKDADGKGRLHFTCIFGKPI